MKYTGEQNFKPNLIQDVGHHANPLLAGGVETTPRMYGLLDQLAPT